MCATMDMYKNVQSNPVYSSQNQKQSKYLSSVECLGKLWSIHTVECCIAMKMKTIVACNGKNESHNIMLSEKARLGFKEYTLYDSSYKKFKNKQN